MVTKFCTVLYKWPLLTISVDNYGFETYKKSRVSEYVKMYILACLLLSSVVCELSISPEIESFYRSPYRQRSIFRYF